jgi:hypothetical protein
VVPYEPPQVSPGQAGMRGPWGRDPILTRSASMGLFLTHTGPSPGIWYSLVTTYCVHCSWNQSPNSGSLSQCPRLYSGSAMPSLERVLFLLASEH